MRSLQQKFKRLSPGKRRAIIAGFGLATAGLGGAALYRLSQQKARKAAELQRKAAETSDPDDAAEYEEEAATAAAISEAARRKAAVADDAEPKITLSEAEKQAIIDRAFKATGAPEQFKGTYKARASTPKPSSKGVPILMGEAAEKRTAERKAKRAQREAAQKRTMEQRSKSRKTAEVGMSETATIPAERQSDTPSEKRTPGQSRRRKRSRESMDGGGGRPGIRCIMFRADWCGWCEKAKPEWRRFARDTPGEYNGVPVEVVEITDDQITETDKAKYQIQGFPTFIFEQTGTGVHHKYKHNERTAPHFRAALAAFAKRYF